MAASAHVEHLVPRPTMLVQVSSPNGAIYAGLEIDTTNYVVSRTAPIIRYVVGMKRSAAEAYFKRRGWKWTVIPVESDEVCSDHNFAS